MQKGREQSFFGPPHPRVIAHRGASGRYPENTLEAFAAAAAAGAPYFELDVHMTRDGEVVVCHDPDLRRTTNRQGEIKELLFEEIAEADAGYYFQDENGDFAFRGRGIRIPRLAEILAAFPTVRVVVEVKQKAPSLVPSMLEVFNRTGAADRVLVASEHQEPLSEVRALAPAIPTNFSATEVAEFIALTRGVADRSNYRPPGDALQIPPRYESVALLTDATVAKAHDLGVEVHVWTINDPAEMRSLLNLGVDGIITDFPDRLLQILGSPK